MEIPGLSKNTYLHFPIKDLYSDLALTKPVLFISFFDSLYLSNKRNNAFSQHTFHQTILLLVNIGCDSFGLLGNFLNIGEAACSITLDKSDKHWSI